jgi:hypothetical protein
VQAHHVAVRDGRTLREVTLHLIAEAMRSHLPYSAGSVAHNIYQHHESACTFFGKHRPVFTEEMATTPICDDRGRPILSVGQISWLFREATPPSLLRSGLRGLSLSLFCLPVSRLPSFFFASALRALIQCSVGGMARCVSENVGVGVGAGDSHPVPARAP